MEVGRSATAIKASWAKKPRRFLMKVLTVIILSSIKLTLVQKGVSNSRLLYFWREESCSTAQEAGLSTSTDH